jgi:hypothetical protein
MICINCHHDERLHDVKSGCSKCRCRNTFTRAFMRKLQIIVFTLAVYFAFTISANAQSACPADLVCLTPAAARAALEAGDKAKALEAAAKVKDQAIADLKDELAKVRITYAECKGEGTILKQDKVEWMAEKELLLKLARPKKFGIINF